ncbi:MAG: M28 family metallopeptidase [bacterium]
MKKINIIYRLFLMILLITLPCFAQHINEQDNYLPIFHSISSHTLYDYVEELASEKYGGRLTGTVGFDSAAAWCASLFQDWGIESAGDNNSYFQDFDIAYTLVFSDCKVQLSVPFQGDTLVKLYSYYDEFIPGATSASGEITAEVVYAGYGITAPELDYDDYKDIQVKDKIILIESEVPVSVDDEKIFQKWRPYSFHQYKLKNAVKHGARGMLYNYGPIVNPNNAYNPDFIYSHIGEEVVSDIFSGTGKKHREVVENIKKKLTPESFSTNKIVTIKNTTEYHPEGKGANVIGFIEGNNAELKEEVIVLGGHLDHLGSCYERIPGANDNASGVAVVLGAAQALSRIKDHLQRSVLFVLFGAEEQGVIGSKVFLDEPPVSLENIVCFLNFDGVGCGNTIHARGGENYPDLWKYISKVNDEYIKQDMKPYYTQNITRPRLDAVRFIWKGVPSISFSVSGAPSYYHTPQDDIDTITPEIMEDLTRIIFMSVIEMANTERISE